MEYHRICSRQFLKRFCHYAGRPLKLVWFRSCFSGHMPREPHLRNLISIFLSLYNSSRLILNRRRSYWIPSRSQSWKNIIAVFQSSSQPRKLYRMKWTGKTRYFSVSGPAILSFWIPGIFSGIAWRLYVITSSAQNRYLLMEGEDGISRRSKTGAILHGHFTREPVKIAKLPGFSLKRGNMQILHYTRSNAVKRRSNHFWLFRTGFSHLTLFRENFPWLSKNKIFPTAGICLKRFAILNATGSNHDILFSHRME